MDRKTSYILFGFLLLLVRLVLNYHSSLIPGINGGYYPLQVRSILNTGQLGFPDMPLYFYFNALLAKLISLTGTTDIDQITIHCSKILDSASLPFFVIPLYMIEKHILKGANKTYVALILVFFVTLSFSPLALTSDLQKNAFAIPLMTFYLHYLLFYYTTRSRKHLFLFLLFFILTGLTHFGVFVVSAAFLILSLSLFFGRKAILPILLLVVAAVSLVAVFDNERAFRILASVSTLVEKPVLIQPKSSLEILNYLLSYLLIGSGFYCIIKFSDRMPAYYKKLLTALILLIFLLSFPLMDMEYARRFSLMLFIPQFIVLHILFRYIRSRPVRVLYLLYLVLFTGTSFIMLTGRMKPASISEEAFLDLKNMEKYLEDPENTLIIARHGLEWWTAWQLGTKVGQDKSVDRNTVHEYEKLIILVQLSGINATGPAQGRPFHEPFFPVEKEAFYTSEYFRATELDAEDFDRIPPPPPPP